MIRILGVLAAFAATVFTNAAAQAHRFDVALVASYSGPMAARGSQVRDGFLRATAERDAHSGQESDGHLGGLDVYIVPVDSAGDAAALGRRLTAAVERGGIEFVAAVRGAADLAALRAITARAGLILLTVPGEAASGYEAGGYALARRIDGAVRARSGDFSNRAAVCAALARAGSGAAAAVAVEGCG
jgi:hypothetical protein